MKPTHHTFSLTPRLSVLILGLIGSLVITGISFANISIPSPDNIEKGIVSLKTISFSPDGTSTDSNGATIILDGTQKNLPTAIDKPTTVGKPLIEMKETLI